MRVVVTGAAGFLGAALSKRLIEIGHEVVGVDGLTGAAATSSQLRRLDPLLDHPRFRLVYADLATAEIVALLREVEVVYHLAGEAGSAPSWGARFGAYARNNVLATQRVLDAAADAHVSRVINASSVSVYGVMGRVPTTEEVVPHPASPDGVTKLAAEGLAELYRDQRGLSVTSLRLVTVYGPGQSDTSLVARMVRAARTRQPFVLRGSASVRRDLVHIDDAVRGFLLAAQADWDGIVNIGGGPAMSIEEVLDLVREQVGAVTVQLEPPRPGDLVDMVVDQEVARRELGYLPEVQLSEGLRDLARWGSGGQNQEYIAS